MRLAGIMAGLGNRIRGIGQAATQRKGCKRSAAPAGGWGQVKRKEEWSQERLSGHEDHRDRQWLQQHQDCKRLFSRGLTAHDAEPVFKDDLLVYDGRYYLSWDRPQGV